MNRRRLLIPAFLWVLPFLSGCVKPVLTIPEQPPPIVKSHRSVTLFAGTTRMLNTGVRLEKGDVYSLFATGEMDCCPRGNCGYHNVSPEIGLEKSLLPHGADLKDLYAFRTPRARSSTR